MIEYGAELCVGDGSSSGVRSNFFGKCDEYYLQYQVYSRDRKTKMLCYT